MPEELRNTIIRDFGSVAEFEKRFKDAAVGVFGSGWAWLAQDKDGRLHIIQESNAGNPLRAGYKPLLTIDVWEHAYYIDYRNRRAEFVNKCWEIIDWKKVAARMHKPSTAAAVKDLARFVCITCGWVYDPAEGDPESGIPPGTPFEDIPEEWLCPACGVGKEMFEKER
jgi:Fe-Mn family superoxide dismutase